MRFTFISSRGDILPLAQTVEKDGHEVGFYICPPGTNVAEGVLTNFGPDVIIIDTPGFGGIARKLKRYGFPVFGGSQIGDILDNSSKEGEKILHSFGVTLGSEGLEVEVEGWFNGNIFLNILYTADNVVGSGCKNDPLYKQSLGKLVKMLNKAQHVGPVSVTAHLKKESVVFNNLRAQFTMSTMLGFKEGYRNRLAEGLLSLASGVNKMTTLLPNWYMGVEISFSPDRLFTHKPYEDIIINGITKDVLKHLVLYGVSPKKNVYYYTGPGGRFAIATSRGDTVREVRRRTYRTIHNVSTVGMLYLPKLGSKASLVFTQAKTWKYIT